MAAADSTIYHWRPTWADRVVDAKGWLLVGWILLQILAFNGQWRIGFDSAQFRGIARSLAAGEGFAILGQPNDSIYPGLPYLLSWLERLFGDAAWPGVVIMLCFALTTVLVTYRLVHWVFPDWASIVITAGVAFNWRFVMQGHELMTDMPFLCGVVLVLLALELWHERRRGWIASLGILALGLLLVATMRPTVWVLVVALCVVALQKMWPRLVTVFASGVVLGLAVRNPGELWIILHDDLPRLFFGERVVVLNVVFTLSLLSGTLLLVLRRDDLIARRPLWVWIVAVLLAVLLVYESEPRYWLMVLPILWAGWLLGLMQGAATYLPAGRSRDWIVGLGVLMVFLGNGIHVAKFVLEQRATPFLAHYKDGEFEPLQRLATELRTGTEPDRVLIGPYAPILSYLSQRRILGEVELGYRDIHDEAGRLLAARDSEATWMVFPEQPYEEKEPNLASLIRQGWLYASNEDPDEAVSLFVTGDDGIERMWWAARFFIDEERVPREHWRRLNHPTTREAP
jgi:hypothetical protein